MDAVYEAGMLDENRRLWKYIVFGMLTFGIYDLIFMWKMINDLNKACALVEENDDDRSPNYIVLVLLTFITFGIYMFVWYYKQGNRIKRCGTRYGFEIDENGSTYLLWHIVGVFLFGVGPLVAMYLLISNINKLCRLYNYQLQGGSNQEQQSAAPEEYEGEAVSENVWSTSTYYGTPEYTPTTGLRDVGLIRCIKGSISGAEIEIRSNNELTVGRSSSMCQLILSEPDISRRHCTIKYSAMDGTYYVTDYSTYGVYMNDSQKLEKEVPTRCPAGTKLTLGNGSNAFLLQ